MRNSNFASGFTAKAQVYILLLKSFAAIEPPSAVRLKKPVWKSLAKPPKKALTEQVLKMYADYNRPVDIGKALGINCATVRKILHANNVYIRRSWEYPKY